jgi:MarR family transcriptional regulator, organic hydroperoxide resistance regulator
MENEQSVAEQLSDLFAEIYYRCHPEFTLNLSHQSIRALQFIGLEGTVTVQEVAERLGCARNTASEILHRMADKGLITRKRRKGDERVVELRITADGQSVLQEQTGLDLGKLARSLAGMDQIEREQIMKGFELLLSAVKEE